MIALETAPYFYALSRNYGHPEEDIQALYQDGLLSQPAKIIFDTLLTGGPLDTVNLRRKIHMTSKSSNSPFDRGLVELQRDFKVTPVGIAKTGGWRYSFIYELVHRYYPEIPARPGDPGGRGPPAPGAAVLRGDRCGHRAGPAALLPMAAEECQTDPAEIG